MAGQLHALAAETGSDEIAVLTTAYDPAVRRESYTLLAQAWGQAALAIAAE